MSSLRQYISAKYDQNGWVRLAASLVLTAVNLGVVFGTVSLCGALELSVSPWIGAPILIAWIFALALFFTWLTTAGAD